MSEKFRKATHIIFDLDGLLLDTEKLYTEATQNILNDYNETYTWNVKMSLMGMRHMEMCNKIVDLYKLPITPEEFSKKQKHETAAIMSNAKLMPGAERLIRHLHAHKIPICLATSSSEEMVELKTVHHRELFQLLHHRVCGSTDPEVKNGKPAPDIFLIAASRFPDNPPPEQCLVFEDAPNGVQAACRAGMQVVMVPDERVPENLPCMPTLRIKSLLDFKPEMFGLPAFANN